MVGAFWQWLGLLATARVLWRLRRLQSVERAQAPACVLANSTRKCCAIPGSPGIYTGIVLVFFLKEVSCVCGKMMKLPITTNSSKPRMRYNSIGTVELARKAIQVNPIHSGSPALLPCESRLAGRCPQPTLLPIARQRTEERAIARHGLADWFQSPTSKSRLLLSYLQ